MSGRHPDRTADDRYNRDIHDLPAGVSVWDAGYQRAVRAREHHYHFGKLDLAILGVDCDECRPAPEPPEVGT